MFFLSFCQNNIESKITFSIDTDTNHEGYKMYGTIPNDKDSAAFIFDGGFKNDSITIIINNNIKYSKVFNSEWSTAHAGSIRIPKTKEMNITICINDKSFVSFKFNKDFSIVHLNYYEKKLKLVYTNQVYIYD